MVYKQLYATHISTLQGLIEQELFATKKIKTPEDLEFYRGIQKRMREILLKEGHTILHVLNPILNEGEGIIMVQPTPDELF
jgi:hypothetical protein